MIDVGGGPVARSEAEALVDVVVVGGGVAGCATALSLLQRGVRDVLVLDRPRPPGVRIGESVPPDTRLLLRRLGVWEDFVRQGHEPCYGSCSAWGAPTLGHNDFLCNPLGAGWHLDRERFDTALLAAVRRAGARVRDDVRVLGVHRRGGGPPVLELTSGAGSGRERLRARLVVDAGGTRSAVARALGAGREELDRLTFACGTFDLPDPAAASRLTLLEAEPEGWWYAAALPGGRLAVALAGDPDHLRGRRLLEPGPWLERLGRTAHASRWVAGARLDGDLVVRSAPSFALRPCAGPDWLAVGDAASGFDPLSAQGLYKALEDGLGAGALLADALTRDRPLDAEAHTATVHARYATYLQQRAHFYGLERRWPDSGFWRARRSVAAGTAALGPSA